jgi:hypothetical protein
MWQAEIEVADEYDMYRTTDSTITTTASQREDTLPTGTMTIHRCEWNSVKLKKINTISDLDVVEGTAYGGLTVEGNPVYYYEHGDKIGYSPIPDAAQTVKLWLSKIPTEITSSSTAFSIKSQYGHYLIDYMLHRAYLKDDNVAKADKHEARWIKNKSQIAFLWSKVKDADKYIVTKTEDVYTVTEMGII